MNEPLKKRLMRVIHGEEKEPTQCMATINQAIEAVAADQKLIAAAIHQFKTESFDYGRGQTEESNRENW